MIKYIKCDFHYVLAEENRIIQMLFNLFYYAIKNTDNETIVISASNINNIAILKIMNVSINYDDNETFFLNINVMSMKTRSSYLTKELRVFV